MDAIYNNFNDKGLTKIARREVGSKVLFFASFFDAQVSLILPLIGIKVNIINQKSRDQLGMKYERDLMHSMVEMV